MKNLLLYSGLVLFLLVLSPFSKFVNILFLLVAVFLIVIQLAIDEESVAKRKKRRR